MKRGFGLGMLLLLFLCGIAQAQQNVPPPAKAFASAQEISYDSVPNFLKLPTGLYLGEGIGVARDSKGHVFVYTRGGDTSHLYEFDPNHSFAREIGKGFYGFQMAHAVRVDPQGNIWVVDDGNISIASIRTAANLTTPRSRKWNLTAPFWASSAQEASN